MTVFQERFVSKPFWMLVGCILLNRASWTQAHVPHAGLRIRWPTPLALAEADPDDVERVVRPVGLARQRARRLIEFAAAWVEREPKTRSDVLAMPGCGPYAADSFAIFVEGRIDLAPSDHHLAGYLERVRSSS